MKPLCLTILDKTFSVCRFEADSPLPDLKSDFFSIVRTPDELSLILEESQAPDEGSVERGWKILKVEGPLDFALTGVMSSLTLPLSKAGISLFALSTYETDYLLVKQDKLKHAIECLRQAGFLVHEKSRAFNKDLES